MKYTITVDTIVRNSSEYELVPLSQRGFKHEDWATLGPEIRAGLAKALLDTLTCEERAKALGWTATESATSPELKPCPFCGSDTASSDGDGNAGPWEVCCGTCQAYTWGETAEEAVAEWNRRPETSRTAADDSRAKLAIERDDALDSLESAENSLDAVSTAYNLFVEEVTEALGYPTKCAETDALLGKIKDLVKTIGDRDEEVAALQAERKSYKLALGLATSACREARRGTPNPSGA